MIKQIGWDKRNFIYKSVLFKLFIPFNHGMISSFNIWAKIWDKATKLLTKLAVDTLPRATAWSYGQN